MAAVLRLLHRGCLGLVLAWLAFAASAQNLQEVPAPGARVLDQTATLTEAQRLALDNKLAAFETSAGSQLVVLIVPTTAPEDIASYANRVGNAWKLGRKDVGDGLLLVVAKNDRKLRIEVAKALEGAVPDVAAKHVIDEVITPRFKQGDFAGGLDAGVGRLMELVKKEGLPAPASPPAPTNGTAVAKALGALFGLTDVALTLSLGISGLFGAIFFSFAGAVAALVAWYYTESFVATLVVGVLGYVYSIYTMAKWAGQGDSKTTAVTAATPASTPSNSSWWSSSDSGSSGSSFSSGGGGDFGGGGASGSW